MYYILYMNKFTFIVFLTLSAAPLQAADMLASIAELESKWAVIYYENNEEQQQQLFPVLLEKSIELVKRYPNAAEPKIWQATIMTTYAGVQSSLTALATLDAAKALLEEAIKQNPEALEGAAYLTLGTLYYKVPAWPVSFGDKQIAEQLLKTSLKINPKGIDANYFYADFLLREDRTVEAEFFFRKAIQAPVRKEQILADTQLQKEAKQALGNNQLGRRENDSSRSASFFAILTLISK